MSVNHVAVLLSRSVLAARPGDEDGTLWDW
jgi:hypothetical protein